jgi:LuxR family quorum-sensing transcriptional regulator LasR
MYRTNTPAVGSSPTPFEGRPPEPQAPQVLKLTARETEILQWTAAGKSSWEIAQIIRCTEAGVNYHFCNIRRKFGVRSRWIAMVKALEQGLIQSP